MTSVRVPPGRAGRLWLRNRSDFARRSLELLDRKQLLLRQELERARAGRDTAREAWTDACLDARQWGLRAELIGGASDVAMAGSGLAGHAQVDVRWRNTMGVTHPDDARLNPAVLAPMQAAATNSALGVAAAAYREALRAAVAFAVIERACDALERELSATQRRRRSIERHRLPALQDALERLELRLDELEREERVVNRWAKDTSRSPSFRQGGAPRE